MGELVSENLGFMDRGPYNFKVLSGQVCGISGGSGAGKTLLLRALADLDPHTGKLLLGGVDSEIFSGPQWRRKVSFLPAENLWWFEQVGRHFSAAINETWLNRLGFAHDVLGWEVSRLSSGEKQRLALLRLLQNKPEVLLLDEPTASLDQKNVVIVEEFVLSYIKESAAACVWVSHDAEQLARLADCHYEILSAGEMRLLR